MRITPTFPIDHKRPKRNRAEEESPWFKFGTDADYQRWCRQQPSAFSDQTNDIVFAHYRTAQNSGTGIKPVFSGIPLTDSEHKWQHQHGQYALMPKHKWERLVQAHLLAWSKSKQ